MGRINKSDFLKAKYYFRRNGLKKTWYAVRERLEEKKQPPYRWNPLTEGELEKQRLLWEQNARPVSFSILVPTYRTKAQYLREMIESVCTQTYPEWELILADATEDDSVERIVRSVEDARIRYVRLGRNGGIAENTNQALSYAAGDYVALLDHDDILTPNALHEAAVRIEERKRRGTEPEMLYSDEDKCNGDRTEYFEPHFKEDFNLDLLFSNNYICHFLIMRKDLIRKLKFRQEYEGSQDFDLVLRAARELEAREEAIIHIPMILYHWRCHAGSTSENPQSKLYAYEAGRRAVQDYADMKGWKARAVNTSHVGFYTLRYEGSLFDSRQDVGAVGGRLVHRGRICGGRMEEDGAIVYGNLPRNYSGCFHRASLPQNAAAVDIRNIQVRTECRELFRQITGIPYRTIPGTDIFDDSLLPKDCDICRLSLKLCQALREAGYRILYLPEQSRDIGNPFGILILKRDGKVRKSWKK